MLQEFISDYSLDILSLTETWLPSDPLPSVINSLTPPNYSFIHSPRLHGKGLALIYRSYRKIMTILLAVQFFMPHPVYLHIATRFLISSDFHVM